jgi:hypothetical protein
MTSLASAIPSEQVAALEDSIDCMLRKASLGLKIEIRNTLS